MIGERGIYLERYRASERADRCRERRMICRAKEEDGWAFQARRFDGDDGWSAQIIHADARQARENDCPRQYRPWFVWDERIEKGIRAGRDRLKDSIGMHGHIVQEIARKAGHCDCESYHELQPAIIERKDRERMHDSFVKFGTNLVERCCTVMDDAMVRHSDEKRRSYVSCLKPLLWSPQ